MALGKSVPVISCGASWNIELVYEKLITKYPHLTIILCLDNDSSGLSPARELSKKYKIKYCVPSFEQLYYDKIGKVTDFNDLISKCSQSLRLVCKQLNILKGVNELPEVLRTE